MLNPEIESGQPVFFSFLWANLNPHILLSSDFFLTHDLWQIEFTLLTRFSETTSTPSTKGTRPLQITDE